MSSLRSSFIEPMIVEVNRAKEVSNFSYVVPKPTDAESAEPKTTPSAPVRRKCDCRFVKDLLVLYQSPNGVVTCVVADILHGPTCTCTIRELSNSEKIYTGIHTSVCRVRDVCHN